jgi:uncharacterized membrane protein YphA (DoxX/SURF4 family)
MNVEILVMAALAVLFLTSGVFFIRGRMTKPKKKIDDKMPSIPFYAFQLRWLGGMLLLLGFLSLIAVILYIVYY